MNERLNTNDLAELLSKQTNLSEQGAEKFIDAIADFVLKGIETSKSVKIIGLGIFKVVLVRERESVHIQTGERFLIPAHHKLSFIPDKDLKDNINKPFAFLEPIETTENWLFSKETAEIAEEEDFVKSIENEDTASKFINEALPDDNEPEESVIAGIGKNLETKENQNVISDYSEYEIKNEYYDFINPIVVIEGDDEEVSHQVHSLSEPEEEEYAQLAEEIVVPQFLTTESQEKAFSQIDKEIRPKSAIAATTATDKKKPPLWLWFLLLPLLIVAGVGVGTYAFLHFNSTGGIFNSSKDLLTETTDIQTYQEPLPLGAIPDDSVSTIESVDADDQEIDENTLNADTVKKETKQVTDWLATTPGGSKEQPKRADRPNPEIERKNQELLAKNKKTEASKTAVSSKTKTIPARVKVTQQGQSLRNLASEYYGDPVFWVYIYEYNKSIISDYNRIPLGTELRMPSPQTYGINPNSQSSVEKAYKKQSEYYGRGSWDDYVQ